MTARYRASTTRLPLHSAFDLRGPPEELRAALAVAGLPFPEAPNRCLVADDVRLLRLGPDRIVALAHADLEALLEGRLGAAFAEADSAICVAISDMIAGFAVDGPDCLDILRQGAALDLAETAFPADGATCTDLWGVTAILLRSAAGFIVLVDRSFAGYLENWLLTANGGADGPRPATMQSKPPPYGG
jgi:heterotetrameric sarcosine oxidase gamma subunit